MKTRFPLSFGTALVVALLIHGEAQAVPTSLSYVDAATCDSHSVTLTHELGPAPLFPINEQIGISFTTTGGGFQTCGPSTGPGTNFEVTITNQSGHSWVDLFLVGDSFLTLGDTDGTIDGGPAFKIDNLGVNQPLVSESIAADLVFEPGESWTFVIRGWSALLTNLDFRSIGVGDHSEDSPFSSASIVANLVPVPAPGGLALIFTAGALMLGVARRRRAD